MLYSLKNSKGILHILKKFLQMWIIHVFIFNDRYLLQIFIWMLKNGKCYLKSMIFLWCSVIMWTFRCVVKIDDQADCFSNLLSIPFLMQHRTMNCFTNIAYLMLQITQVKYWIKQMTLVTRQPWTISLKWFPIQLRRAIFFFINLALA